MIKDTASIYTAFSLIYSAAAKLPGFFYSFVGVGLSFRSPAIGSYLIMLVAVVLPYLGLAAIFLVTAAELIRRAVNLPELSIVSRRTIRTIGIFAAITAFMGLALLSVKTFDYWSGHVEQGSAAGGIHWIGSWSGGCCSGWSVLSFGFLAIAARQARRKSRLTTASDTKRHSSRKD